MRHFKPALLSIAILAILSIGLLIISRIKHESYLDFTHLAEATSLFTSVITASFAFLLYKRFTGSQLLVDKQTKEVLNLLEFLSDVRVHFHFKDHGKLVIKNTKIVNATMTDMKLNNLEVPSPTLFKLTKKNLAKYNYYGAGHTFETQDILIGAAHSIYMPINISKIIDENFNSNTQWYLANFDEAQKHPYFSVDFSADEKFYDPKYKSYLMKYVEIDPRVFSDSLCKVFDAAIIWMKRNNTEVYGNLNIQI
ncbi:MAG: hypothetical protein ACR2FM_03560 [Candidatus Saccharimonadales bacterium]